MFCSAAFDQPGMLRTHSCFASIDRFNECIDSDVPLIGELAYPSSSSATYGSSQLQQIERAAFESLAIRSHVTIPITH